MLSIAKTLSSEIIENYNPKTHFSNKNDNKFSTLDLVFFLTDYLEHGLHAGLEDGPHVGMLPVLQKLHLLQLLTLRQLLPIDGL